MHGWESQILRRDKWKSRAKTGKLSFFHGNQGQWFQFRPGRIEDPFLHIIDPREITLKMPQKIQKTYNFAIFQHFPKFWKKSLI